MPRTRLGLRDRTGDLLAGFTRQRGKTLKELVAKCDFCERRMYSMKNDPGSIRLRELRNIANEIDLTDEELLRIVKGEWR